MKIKTILTLAIIVFLASCKKKSTDEAKPTSAVESFSAKINGVLFSPDVAIYYIGQDSTFICSNSVGGGTLNISKYDIANGKVSGTFSFKTESFFGNELKTFTEGKFENVNIQ